MKQSLDGRQYEAGNVTLASRTLDEQLVPQTALDIADVMSAHGDYLWATLQRLGVLPSDLSDALQDVLIVVHRRRNDFDGRTRITAWLYGICLRVAIARRRKAHVRHETVVAEIPTDADVTNDLDPEAAMVQQQERAQLTAVLDAMEPEKRAVFVMYEVEELSCAEIAALIDVPLGTVHSRLHSARKEFERVAARASRGPRGEKR